MMRTRLFLFISHH